MNFLRVMQKVENVIMVIAGFVFMGCLMADFDKPIDLEKYLPTLFVSGTWFITSVYLKYTLKGNE